MNNKLELIFLAIVFALTIFPLTGFALTYRIDLNNGTWNAYKNGFASTYYEPDLYQVANNRDFETDFSFTGVETQKCIANICYTAVNLNTTAERTNTTAQKGTYSAKYDVHGNTEAYLNGGLEMLGDTNISFYYKKSVNGTASTLNWGYINDLNAYVELGSTTDDKADWFYISYIIPKGNFRYQIRMEGGNGTDNLYYFDNLTVGRTNAGTFNKTTTTPFCTSISNCSNATTLKNNSVRDLYFIADYINSGSCTYSINGVNKGSMTALSNGLYYGLIDVTGTVAGADANVSASCSRVGFDSKGFWADANITADNNISTSMTVGNTGTSNFGLKGVNYTFYSKYYDDLNLQLTDATCVVKVNGTNYAMTYDAVDSRHEVERNFIANGVYSIDHNCLRTNFISQQESYNFTVQDSLTDAIDFTPIQNISSYTESDFNKTVDFVPSNTSDDIIFKITAYESFTDLIINFYNDKSGSKQYSIYTSTDGVDYAFNDTLTFGSTVSDPVQKVWDSDQKKYNYSVSLDFADAGIYYYLLRYEEPAIYWETIGNSSDWANTNPPSLLIENPEFGGLHNVDLFQNSSYTHIKSQTIKPYPQLSSISLEKGFEFQFTAYSNTPVSVRVGYVQGDFNGDMNVSLVNITTTPTRYSVFVEPYESGYRYARLLIDSNVDTQARVYISDYAVIPRAYFLDRLEVMQSDGQPLNSVVVNKASYIYVQELTPFKITSRVFNTDGSLDSLITEVLINNVPVKSFESDLSGLLSNEVFVLDKILDGVIDYSGKAQLNGSLQALKDITVRNTLVNKSDQNVAVQSRSYKFLQFPYFPSDLMLNVYPVSSKVGENPVFNVNIKTRDPDSILGIVVYLYDKDHSKQNPNYAKTIYTQDLGCEKFLICDKQIKLTEFSIPDENAFTVGYATILTTENQDYNNYLTFTERMVKATYVVLETARIFQVYERTSNTYTTTEPIPLVLQMRDDQLRNLQDYFDVYLEVDQTADLINWTSVGHFKPVKFIYDEMTGYNYWYWNSLFYSPNGDILDTNIHLRFKAYPIPVKTGIVPTPYGLTNKCKARPSDFFAGSFLFNWVGVLEDATFGCTTPAPTVVEFDDADANYLFIWEGYTPNQLQNHSVFCLRTDGDKTYKQDIGDSFICGVWFLKSEAQIDGFRVYLGNAFSDYAKMGDEAQYISFDIPAEEVMFNDILMLRSALQTEFATDEINTFPEILASGFNKILPVGQPLVDVGQLAIGNGVLLTDVGADINLSEQLNPNAVSGLFFFKIDGLKVVNMNDYLSQYPQLETANPKDFMTFMKAKNMFLPKQQTKITVYSRDFDSSYSFKTNSPLVINEVRPKTPDIDTTDINKPTTIAPTSLKFNFIVDMFSNNRQTANRGLVPIVFSYVHGADRITFNNLLEFANALYNDPVGALSFVIVQNIFILISFVLLVLIISVIYLNFKSGGNGKITIQNLFRER